MGLFNNRKRKLEEERMQREQEELWAELSKPACQRQGGKHMWRDFPMFLDYEWNNSNKRAEICIKEPYVCCLCGERRNKTVGKWTFTSINEERFDKELKKIESQYKDVLERPAIVEDMVHDAIMVDRQKLKYWDAIHAPEELKVETEQEKLARYSIEMFSKPRMAVE